jgi:hypothetical protein
MVEFAELIEVNFPSPLLPVFGTGLGAILLKL